MCLQQFEFIKICTSLEVGEYYGAKGVDEWSLKCWEKEINEHDVSLLLNSSVHSSDYLYAEILLLCFLFGKF